MEEVDNHEVRKNRDNDHEAGMRADTTPRVESKKGNRKEKTILEGLTRKRGKVQKSQL